MRVAYVNTSVLRAICLDEPGSALCASKLGEFSRRIASSVLAAELRAVFARENLPFHETATSGIEWILPDRTLAREIAQVLDTRHLRGADLWHVASALFVSPKSGDLSFATRDARAWRSCRGTWFSACMVDESGLTRRRPASALARRNRRIGEGSPRPHHCTDCTWFGRCRRSGSRDGGAGLLP